MRRALLLAADPTGPKDCGTADGADARAAGGAASDERPRSDLAAAWRHRQRRQLPEPHAGLRRRRGRQTADDVRKALAFARARGLKISTAGVKHSMGGHAFARGGVVLDMTAFNRMSLDAERRVLTVESGATWHDIQNASAPALRGQGDAVDRHLHGRRLDLGQRARHGSSVRIGRRHDPRDARDAAPTARVVQVSRDRESWLFQPRGRRLRPVRRHPRRRSRHRRQRRLSVRAARASTTASFRAVLDTRDRAPIARSA